MTYRNLYMQEKMAQVKMEEFLREVKNERQAGQAVSAVENEPRAGRAANDSSGEIGWSGPLSWISATLRPRPRPVIRPKTDCETC
jgi:hypothetical protein